MTAVIAVVALALLFDFTNGFHDAANSVSTVVATRALPAKWAVWFSAFFNFAAVFIVGTAVANTVAKTVDANVTGIGVVFAALFAAIVWNYSTWWVGMPSSSSHAIIGGLVGAGLAAGGTDAIDWSSVEKTVLAIVISPLVAFGIAFLAMFLVAALRKGFGLSDNARPFKWLQLVSAGAVSFGHGANDAQKTMGIIAALLVGTGHLATGADGSIDVPTWVEFAAYSSIALGTVWGGWKIIETMGLKITTLHASSGVAANVGAVTSIFGATGLGVPISTTHAAASSVAGAGVASGMGINLRVIGEMVVAWVVTLPTTMALAFGVFTLTQLPGALAWVAVGLALAIAGALILYAMTHAITAEDVEAEIPDENVLQIPVPVHPQLEGHGPAA
ncbi:MAG: inorganic phosphate transporter [Actinomycetales bacterium]|nr:inorganic phosphate transporter [Actinomycetales bacterium]